jgi:hypothetical protein
MTRPALPRKRLATVIVILIFVEWILFEIIRTPYRPPYDMTTFLGTEKYPIILFMLGLAVLGLGLIVWWAVRSAWSKRDVITIALLVVVLAAALAYVVFYPCWPVTPLNWVLK